MARIALREDRFATEASEQEYRGLESGDILYFPTSPPLVTTEERRFLVTQRQMTVCCSQEHQLPAKRRTG